MRDLVDRFGEQRDALEERISHRIQDEVPAYRALGDGGALDVAALLSSALSAIRDDRIQSDEEATQLDRYMTTQAELGFSVENVLDALATGVTEAWRAGTEFAQEEGLDSDVLLEIRDRLWAWTHETQRVAMAAHRVVDLARSRDDDARRGVFVQAVLFGDLDIEPMQRTARLLGLDPMGAVRVVRTLDPEATIRGVAGVLRDQVTTPDATVLLASIEGGVVGFVDAELRTGPTPWPIGVSDPTDLQRARLAFADATLAARAAQRAGRATVASLDDVLIDAVILAGDRFDSRLAARYLRPLAAAPSGGTNLVATIESLIDNRMDITRTAQALHVHPNTVRYRRRRFEELTGADLDDPGQCFLAWWAMQLKEPAADSG